MKIKGNLIFLIGAVFVMFVFVSMTMTGCAVQKRTTHEDKSRPTQPDQPPQPGQPPQPAKGGGLGEQLIK